MIPLDIADIAARIGATASGDARVSRVSIDSRTAGPGALFVALRGEVHDGHDHVRQAIERGAVAVMAEQLVADTPCLVVPDSWRGLADLAGLVRDRVDPTVIGVTGSVGKTTTKDMVAAACLGVGPTVAAVGSFNNEAGVPLTLLGCEADTAVLVAELGARGRGHIAELVRTVKPDIGIVTAVAGVHLELFGDIRDIEDTKAELVEGLGADGVAILNLDDPAVARMATRTDARVLGVSIDGRTDADVRATSISLDERACATVFASLHDVEVVIHVPVAGRHHARNALLALAAAVAAGADPDDAATRIGQAVVSAGRAHVRTLGGLVVLDDAYNANPTSTLAALATLAALDVPGRRIAVLGVMAEIGDTHVAEHERVGREVAGVVDALIVVGDEAAGLADGAIGAGLRDVHRVADADAAGEVLDQLARDGDAVLVKASRVARLEAVVAHLATREAAS